MKKSDALQILFQSAKLYEKNLKNKNILFMYYENNNNICFCETRFLSYNFKHLTGIVSKFGANEFYNVCFEQRIKDSDINFRSDGTTKLKLDVLQNIMSIRTTAKMIGLYCGSRIYLKTGTLIGSVYNFIGFTQDSCSYYVPNTAIKGDIRESTNSPRQIVFICSKNITDRLYNTMDRNLKSILYSDLSPEMQEKISPEIF